MFDRLVYSTAKDKMGLDQAHDVFSAAAPLSSAITEFFAGLGMQILNIYGQSECTGLCSFNRPARNLIGSVGPALPGVELKIAADGEIFTRGPNNMLGYMKDPEATGRRSTLRASCTPGTSGTWTTTASCSSPTARRTSSSRPAGRT